MKYVTEALEANGYPKRFVMLANLNSHLNNRQHFFFCSPSSFPAPCHGSIQTGALYVLVNSEALHRMLQGVSVFYRTSRVQRSLSSEFWAIITSKLLKNHTRPSGICFLNRKIQVPKDQTRGTIYSIPCTDCDKSYIGETKRKFSTRLKEPCDQKAVEHKHSHKSALAEHRSFTFLSHCRPGRRLRSYAQVLIGATDAFLKHGNSTLAAIRWIGMMACICHEFP